MDDVIYKDSTELYGLKKLMFESPELSCTSPFIFIVEQSCNNYNNYPYNNIY